MGVEANGVIFTARVKSLTLNLGAILSFYMWVVRKDRCIVVVLGHVHTELLAIAMQKNRWTISLRCG